MMEKSSIRKSYKNLAIRILQLKDVLERYLRPLNRLTLELWSRGKPTLSRTLKWHRRNKLSLHIIALVILLYRSLAAVIRLNFCFDFIVIMNLSQRVDQCLIFYVTFEIISNARYSQRQKKEVTTILSTFWEKELQINSTIGQINL